MALRTGSIRDCLHDPDLSLRVLAPFGMHVLPPVKVPYTDYALSDRIVFELAEPLSPSLPGINPPYTSIKAPRTRRNAVGPIASLPFRKEPCLKVWIHWVHRSQRHSARTNRVLLLLPLKRSKAPAISLSLRRIWAQTLLPFVSINLQIRNRRRRIPRSKREGHQLGRRLTHRPCWRARCL